MEEKSQEQAFDAKYPSKEYNKTIFVFTSEELRKLSSLETISQMGQIANMMISNIVQGQCLPRVSAKNSPDSGVLYDIPAGKFFVYTPKVWCFRCNQRKARYFYRNNNYCDDCLRIVQAEEKKGVPPIEVKQTEAKKEKKVSAGKQSRPA